MTLREFEVLFQIKKIYPMDKGIIISKLMRESQLLGNQAKVVAGKAKGLIYLVIRKLLVVRLLRVKFVYLQGLKREDIYRFVLI